MASPFTQIHATKKYRLGTRAKDSACNEYQYCAGVASLAAGDFVVIGAANVPVRALNTSTGPVAVAMAANTSATNYSWFLINGRYTTANVATHSSGAGKGLFVTSSAGRAAITPATETGAFGAFSDGDSAANVGPVYIVYPVAPGDIST